MKTLLSATLLGLGMTALIVFYFAEETSLPGARRSITEEIASALPSTAEQEHLIRTLLAPDAEPQMDAPPGWTDPISAWDKLPRTGTGTWNSFLLVPYSVRLSDLPRNKILNPHDKRISDADLARFQRILIPLIKAAGIAQLEHQRIRGDVSDKLIECGAVRPPDPAEFFAETFRVKSRSGDGYREVTGRELYDEALASLGRALRRGQAKVEPDEASLDHSAFVSACHRAYGLFAGDRQLMDGSVIRAAQMSGAAPELYAYLRWTTHSVVGTTISLFAEAGVVPNVPNLMEKSFAYIDEYLEKIR